MPEMTKKEWEDLYKRLDMLHRDFSQEHPKAEKGRNEKIRKEARRNREIAIQTAVGYIRGNKEAYKLFMGDIPIGQASAEAIQEFGLHQYFDFEMNGYLTKIKKKIDEFGYVILDVNSITPTDLLFLKGTKRKVLRIELIGSGRIGSCVVEFRKTNELPTSLHFERPENDNKEIIYPDNDFFIDGCTSCSIHNKSGAIGANDELRLYYSSIV